MGRLTDLIFFRNHRICPRWMCFTFDNGLRRLVQNPDKIISPYIREGISVLDVGPGIGFFTIPIAKRVGPEGKVIAADIQEAMLLGIEKRAILAGMRDRIELHLSKPDEIYSGGPVDFILAFWMVHEVPDSGRLFGQLYNALKGSGLFLLVEPKIHVTQKQFNALVETAKQAGFTKVEYPSVPLSYAALMKS